MSQERSCWSEVTQIMAADEIRLGRRTADWFDHDPQQLLSHTAYYKFAAKMLGKNKRVLDVCCGDGLGTWILAAECGDALGIDPDEAAVSIAQGNWTDPRASFACNDLADVPSGPWDGAVCLDVLSRLSPAGAQRLLSRIGRRLAHDGMAIVGVPQAADQQIRADANEANADDSRAGDRLEAEMRRHFRHVFLFGASGEVVQPGLSPRHEYAIAVGCRKLECSEGP